MTPGTKKDNLLPDPGELRDHLLTQLDYLESAQGEMARNQGRIHAAKRKLELGRAENWELNISPNWVLQIYAPGSYSTGSSRRDFSNEDGFALVGGTISVVDGEFKEYSLSLCLLARSDSEVTESGEGDPCCWNGDHPNMKWRVAKRYHFDIDIGGEDEKKPMTHLQSEGKFKKKHLPAPIPKDEAHYCSTPLDKPRLPHPPMDPLLILNIVATQYQNLESMVGEYWIQRVMDAESKMWGGFYRHFTDELTREGRSASMDTFISN